ncbi:MAG: hypothetical protein JWQ09_4764 [Segetibacter sp.]|nr:hypothetical protein [Segetibacter sp.]
MRSKIFIAVMATAIGMSSCDWFTARTQSVQAFNIEGKWKIDSITKGNDSVKVTGSPTLALFSHERSSLQTIFEFKKDTVVAIIPNKTDTLSYKIDNSQIAFKSKHDSTGHTFSFSPINDSLISFTGVDSSAVILKRTK